MLAAILAICGANVFISCSNDDDPAGQQDEYAGVPLIIYDTDIGSSADDLCFKLFTEAGFEWGGDWTTRKDYQHFEIIEQ